VKNTEVGGLAAAARAVASGHTVLSPELHGLYTSPVRVVPGPVPSQVSRRAGSPDHLLRLLTGREHKVLALLAEGLSTAEAAADLKVSPATIKSHVSHALTKLGVRNRLEAVLLVRQLLEAGRDAFGDAESIPRLAH
jgi:DNA-binding NarL/FixJ family response regulator